MRLHEMVGSRNIPDVVDVEYDYSDPVRDIEDRLVSIEFKVYHETDPYGTGDSPEESTAEATGVAYYLDTEEHFDITLVPEKDWSWLQQQAIDQSNSNR